MASTPSLAPPRQPSTAATPRSATRPEIQALRALAVALVIVYHFWPGILRGGFVGVDVFFVISGYLITGHLARPTQLPLGSAILQFWARRIRRLLPASLLVLLVTAGSVFLVVPRNLWQQFFGEILASALYVQNWLLASNSVDYLAANNVQSPVQHYWSLSVEEQFYLAWPVIVLGTIAVVARRKSGSSRRVLAAVLGAVTVLSLAYSAYLTAAAPSVAYFATTTRVWEFAAGGALAVLVPEVSASRAGLRAAVSWAGLALILAGAIFYTGATPFPGVAAALPVVGTLAVLWAAFPDAPFAPSRLYAIRPVQFIGDISYSLYLWHFSLLILASYALRVGEGLVFKLGVLTVTIVLAILTKRFVEDPPRRAMVLAQRRPRRTFFVAGLAMALVVGVAGAGIGVIERAAAAPLATPAATAASCFGAGALAPPKHSCPPVPIEKVVPQPDVAATGTMTPPIANCLQSGVAVQVVPCRFGKASSPIRVALLGDSHAAAWFVAVKTIADERGWQLTTYLKAACPFGTGKRMSATSHPGYIAACARWNTDLTRLLAKSSPFTYVFVTDYEDDSHFVDGSGAYSETAAVDAYQSAWRPLIERGARVIVLHDTPHLALGGPHCITENQATPNACTQQRSRTLDRTDFLTAAANRTPGATALDMNDYFCAKETCPIVVGGVFVYRDRDHFTTEFSESLAPWLLRRLIASGLVSGGK